MAQTASAAHPDGHPRSPAPAPAASRRGQESRERIVGAALSLVAEHGPRSREVSVRAIAAGAGVSTGALYHHFPELESIMTAVAERYMAEMMAAVEAATAGREWTDVAGFINARTTAYVEFFAARPGLREFWFDDRASDGVIEVHRRYRELIGASLQEAFARFTGVTADPVTFQISTVVSGALFELAFRRDPQGDPVVVAELRTFIRRYFQEQHLQENREEPGPA
jgi:AcrR family transcriptional regulator